MYRFSIIFFRKIALCLISVPVDFLCSRQFANYLDDTYRYRYIWKPSQCEEQYLLNFQANAERERRACLDIFKFIVFIRSYMGSEEGWLVLGEEMLVTTFCNIFTDTIPWVWIAELPLPIYKEVPAPIFCQGQVRHCWFWVVGTGIKY